MRSGAIYTHFSIRMIRMENKQSAGLYEGDKVHQYYKRAKTGSKEVTGGIDIEIFEYLERILPESLKGKDVLDIGCGDARWSKNLHEREARSVIAIDSSNDMLALARAKKRREGLHRLSIHKEDMRNLHFPDESFDIVLSSFSIMYFRDVDMHRIVKEVIRVLRLGGSFYIATNVVYLQEGNPEVLKKLQNEIFPVTLGFGAEVVSTENAVQTVEQFKAAFREGHVRLTDEKYFAPIGISIPTGYPYRDYFKLGKAVFVLNK